MVTNHHRKLPDTDPSDSRAREAKAEVTLTRKTMGLAREAYPADTTAALADLADFARRERQLSRNARLARKDATTMSDELSYLGIRADEVIDENQLKSIFH